jgi:ferrochelatase
MAEALHGGRSRAPCRDRQEEDRRRAPAFSADCIETLEEINEEIRESFEEAGGEEFTYIPCLNDDDAHIDALATVVSENLKGWV